MKVSRKLWIIIMASLVVIAFISLGTLCWQQFNKQNQLKEELSLIEDRVQEFQSEKSSNRKEVLELKLAETLDVMQTSESLFSRPSWDIVISSLFDIAEACNIEVTWINSGGLGSQNLGGIPATTQQFTITVEGTLGDLITFLTRVNHDLKTSVIKSVDIKVPTDAQTRPSASFLLVVYTYRGS